MAILASSAGWLGLGLAILLVVHFGLYLGSNTSDRVFRWLQFFEVLLVTAIAASIFIKPLMAAKG